MNRAVIWVYFKLFHVTSAGGPNIVTTLFPGTIIIRQPEQSSA
jgi:hypothetical protein